MQTDWYKNAIFYGLDVSRFYDSDGNGTGDLDGVIKKLDYIQSLGVTCLWLLPFYPSDRRDNGYDITEYLAVDRELGTLPDFCRLIDAAHQRGLKVIIDLVVHHTSNEHPWFVAASHDRSSEFHDYYIWAAEPPAQTDPPVFKGEDKSTWQYAEPPGAYYHHKFYAFEPDLNVANRAVWRSIKSIADFWLSLDVDGFRIDAATHMFDRKGIAGTAVDAGAYMEDLRSFVDERKPGAVLLAEADVGPDKLQQYFGGGNRMQLLYNFLLNNSIFLGLARQSARPLIDRLQQQRRIDGHGSWMNFIRNLDELDLGHLSPRQLQDVYEAFAPEPQMRIYGSGIRRAVPPMMQNRDQLRLLYSLLFALPGAPMFVYGAEIGLGDNLALQGRSSVRLPMQWNGGQNGGFSAAKPGSTPLLQTVCGQGDYRYENVNVQREQTEQGSLLHFFQRAIATRRRYPQIGLVRPDLPDTGSEAVLALAYPGLLVLHNLSDKPQTVKLQLPHGARTVFGQDCKPGRSLEAYGFSWLTAKDDGREATP